jgi:predicted transcriptional regulator YheO
MTEKECIFINLQRIADAVVSLLGKNCEACIHDLTLLENSLVYIQGDVTGRKPGAPATDLLIKMLQQNSGKALDKHNYKTTTADGRSLKSTTTFIRDAIGKPLAAFCINLDTTDFYNASQALMPFINIQENNHQARTETFAHSAGETVEALFFHAVEDIGKHPATMNVDEKTELTRRLEENGTFLLKGAVEQVAQMMGVTKFTVYNYLKKVRSNNSTMPSEV